MKQFIPSNVDIQQLLEAHPPKRIKKFSKDKLIHILHLIVSVPANNKDLEIIEGFVPLHSQVLKRRIPNYKQYLVYLEHAGVLESDQRYIKGHKSKGYRFASKYQTDLTQESITNRSLIKHQRHEGAIAASRKKLYAHLTKWFNPGLQINYDLAIDFIHSDREKKLRRAAFKINDDNSNALHSIYTQFTSSYINIERIRSSDFFLSVDNNVHRLLKV